MKALVFKMGQQAQKPAALPDDAHMGDTGFVARSEGPGPPGQERLPSAGIGRHGACGANCVRYSPAYSPPAASSS
jgi:hypothetical protein